MAQRTKHPQKAGRKPPFPKQTQKAPGLEKEMRPRPDYGEATYQGHGRLKDRIAVITGADSGIGRAVALAFAREGANVVISYLSEHEDATETKRAVESSGAESLLSAGDLANESYCLGLIEGAVERFGRIDLLVNNAVHQVKGIKDFDELTADRVEHSFRVNVVAMFNLVRVSLPHMKPGSAIINVASIQAYDPDFELLDYAATKGAIVTFTKGLAKELINRGIRVNAVAPGPVWTPLITVSDEPDEVARFGEESPMKRPAQPAELAPAFVFLASEEAQYINGEVLGVTGGSPLP